jgi:membrane fusion protein, multidrug efflux system
MDGYVKEKKVEVGNYMQANQVAVTLVDNNPIYLSVDIPQNRIAGIKAGKDIVITTDAVPGKTFCGKIVQISPVVNPETRTVTVRSMINNPEYILKPGMFSKVSLITGVDESAIMVSKAALLEEMGVTKLFVLRKDAGVLRAHAIKVTKGESQGDLIRVIGDVQDGDPVAVSSLAVLVDGTKVNIQAADKSQTPESP